MVYVLNNDGSPLMPCTEAKARHLVEGGKAKVVRRTPFIIRLAFLVEGEVNTEAVTLGVDAGSSLIGVSVTTEGRVLLEAEVEVRNDVPQNMEERRSKRSGRRNRKTRYREARTARPVTARPASTTGNDPRAGSLLRWRRKSGPTRTSSTSCAQSCPSRGSSSRVHHLTSRRSGIWE